MGDDGKAKKPMRAARAASWKDLLTASGPLIGLVAVFLLFASVAPPAFVGAYNCKTIVTQTVIIGIGALGMTFVIIAGGIDLSVGSVIALATVVIAGVLRMGPENPSSAWVVCAAAASVAVGGFFGALNGALSSYLRIVPFIITLGTMQIARGVAKWLAKEQTVMAPQTWLNGLMDVSPQPEWLIFAPGVWLLLFLAIVMFFVLRYTILGRHTFAIGSNEKAARLCGISLEFNRVVIYALCGMFTGIAGIMQFANLTVGDPTAANGMELDIIAAVVIGGGSLRGGEGGVIASVLGALLMAVLHNGCNLIGIPNYVQNIVTGAIIIGAVAMDRFKHAKSEA
jgi:ribose transport system permease protein